MANIEYSDFIDLLAAATSLNSTTDLVPVKRTDGSVEKFGFGSTTEVLTGTSTVKMVTPDALAALWEQGTNIPSATTLTIGDGGYFHVTGTTTITDIDFTTDKAGRAVKLVFDGILTLTHNASTLILPTDANITTAAGDTALFISEGSDVVRCVGYQRASGAALGGSSPLTTKGDIFGFSTANARIPVGTNGQVLTAASGQALGVEWATPTAGTVTGTGTVNRISKWTSSTAQGDSLLDSNTTDVSPSAAGTIGLGTNALPFTKLFIGNAATNNIQLTGTASGGAKVATFPDATGTVVLNDNTATLTNKRITARVTTIASSATPTPDGDASDEFTVTALAANATFAAPTGTPTNGQALLIRILDNGTPRTLAYNAIYRAVGVTLPVTTVASKTIYLGMFYNSADSKWDVVGYREEL